MIALGLVAGGVGPLSFGEHIAWFLLLSLFVSLVYNGLRVESLREAAGAGLRRWAVFVLGSAALALVSHLIVEGL